jgi:membrane-associated PAP2 superfamily phosphatase
MRWKNMIHPDIGLIGLLGLLMLSLPFVFTNLDLTLAGLFYQQGWPIGDQQPWLALYRYGALPGLVLAAGGLLILVGVWIWPILRMWRRAALIVVLTLALGPGLLVNVLGKQYWGRPRPRDVIQFNGQETFRRFIQPGVPGGGYSFPCGHASVGFLFTALYFTAREKKWKWIGLIGGLTYGVLMGIGRMAQGAHFASDVLWSGGLTYLSAAWLHHVFLPAEDAVQRNLVNNTPP